jgi:hypothetical protein
MTRCADCGEQLAPEAIEAGSAHCWRHSGPVFVQAPPPDDSEPGGDAQVVTFEDR